MINTTILTQSQSKPISNPNDFAYFFKVSINMHEKCKRP